MSDQLSRFVSKDGQLRAIGAATSSLCEESRRRQGTDPTATVALARLTTGTALLGGLLKGNERLALAIEANGPLQKLHAETDAHGHIRSSVKNPLANLPPLGNSFDVANAVGKAGFLHVIKDLGLKEPYRGTVQLQTSEIGDDIAYYLTSSEQVPSLVSLGVALGPDAEVEVAGGFMIQALPGCREESIDQIEKKISSLPALSSMLRAGDSIEKILLDIFADIPCSQPESTPLVFRCNCSRKQVAAILNNLDQDEAAAQGKEPVEVTCEYCRRLYRFSPAELAEFAG